MISVTSVDRLVRESCARGGDRTLMTYAEDGSATTYRAFDAQISRAAHVLQGLGVRPGDRVSLFLRNHPHFFAPWLGTVRLGAIANPINLGLEKNVDRIVYMLEKLKSRVFILEQAFRDVARAVRGRLPGVSILLVDSPEGSDLDWSRSLAAASASFPEVAVRPEDPFQMIFTSGTTGLPKAVVQRHEMLTDSFALCQDHFRFGPEDVLMCVLPLFHVNSQYTSFFPALGLGAKLVLFEKFSASRFFTTIQSEGVTAVSVVPSLLTRLLAHGIPKDRTLWKTLKFIICGAAPLSAELQREFTEKTGIPVPNGWGMTETGCWGCHSDPARIVPGSMGKALPINEMKIVDPQTGKDLPPGETGTLLIRGRNVFREYFDAPEATAKAFRFGGDWFDTGDDARMDADGNLFFVGRGSVDTGKVDGEFVNFLSIDEKLATHPKILEVCCVGVPDAIRGSVVAACVVAKPGTGLTESEVTDHAAKCGLPKYEMPRFILFVPEIPKGDTGKIQRKVMTERAVGALLRP